jgi:small redox-active disulfide protein 2
MGKIQVIIFGFGCSLFRLLMDNLHAASAELGIELEVQEVTDIQAMLDLGVSAIPALAIEGQVVVSGQVPAVHELAAYLQRHGEPAE